MKEIGATYDPTKNPFTPIEAGFYPAHVVGFGTRTTKCKHLVGKKFRDNGTFVFTGDESSGRNRRYFDLLSTLGVDLNEDSNGNFPLSLLEEDDVIGVPVLARLGSEEYEKDGEKRTAWKVFNVEQWNDGQRISKEEIKDDLPF